MKPKDKNRDELISMGNALLKRHGNKIKLWFKFTCAHCGERCTFTEPNTLFETGECASCNKDTVVTKGGFSLEMVLDHGEIPIVDREDKT